MRQNSGNKCKADIGSSKKQYKTKSRSYFVCINSNVQVLSEMQQRLFFCVWRLRACEPYASQTQILLCFQIISKLRDSKSWLCLISYYNRWLCYKGEYISDQLGKMYNITSCFTKRVIINRSRETCPKSGMKSHSPCVMLLPKTAPE